MNFILLFLSLNVVGVYLFFQVHILVSEFVVLFSPSTVNLHLSSASASLAHIQTNVSPCPGSRLSAGPFALRSGIPVFARLEEPARRFLAEPRRRHRDAGADPAEAQALGGGGAQAERHEVPLRVRGPLRRQHPGGVQHRNQQDAARGGGRHFTFHTTSYRGCEIPSF